MCNVLRKEFHYYNDSLRFIEDFELDSAILSITMDGAVVYSKQRMLEALSKEFCIDKSAYIVNSISSKYKNYPGIKIVDFETC